MSIVTEQTILRAKDLDARFNLAPDSRSFDCRFIEPGLINYSDQRNGGIELLRKETIDRCISTAVGNPVTNGHVLVTADNRVNVEQGIVQDWYYNAEDGWYYVKGTADTTIAQDGMRKHRPSCGYVVTAFGPGGTYHGIRYDREITGILFNHLAIVEKPRYEGAIFRLNSIVNPNSNMNLFKLIQKLVTRENGADGKPVETPKEVTTEVDGNTEVEIDGKMVRLNQLAEVFTKAQATPPAPSKVSGDDVVEIGGKPVKVSELVDAYRKNSAAPATPPTPKKEETPASAQPSPEEVERNNNAFFSLRSAANKNASGDNTGIVTSSGSLAERVKRGSERY